jgi:hypothetical protein
MQLYQVFKEGLSSKPKFIPYPGELPTLDINRDYYISLFQYDEAQRKLAETKGSLTGIKDTTTDKLYFDFDSKNDLEAARKDALTLAQRLVDRGVDPDDIHAAFTGSKGFSVEIKLNKRISNEQFKAAVQKLAGDLKTFDHVVSDPNRIVRIDYTRHNKSGNLKLPLKMYELDEWKMDDIVNTSKTISHVAGYKQKNNPVSLQEDLFIVPQKKKEKVEITGDLEEALERLPKGWKNYKWALASGFFEPGERHNALMVIAATCRGLGYDKDTAYYICKAAMKKQAARSGSDEFPKDELYENIIDKSVYSDNWEGGQYSPQTNPWLKSYCERMGFEVKKEEETKARRIQDIQDEFRHFVENIEENTILTGIPCLDQAMPITIGMNLGIVGAASSGKCLGKDTPVLMFDGTIKKVQDVKTGDVLMGDDSTPRNVLTTCKGKEQLYKIHQANGDSYVVNESHILSLKCGLQRKGSRAEKFKKQVLDIELKDYLNESKEFKRYYKGYKVGVEFKEQPTNIDPYLMGLWLGDGDKNEPRITNNDRPIINELKFISSQMNMGYSVTEDKRNGVTTFRFNNLKHVWNTPNKLEALLKEDKVLGNKHIPESYLLNSRKNRLALLAGLIDSDGHYSSSGHYEITLADEKLANQIQFLTRSLGFKSTLTIKDGGCEYKGEFRPGTYYRLYFNGKELKDIPVVLERKKATHQVTREILSTSIKVEKLEVGNYYGFEIDGNHRFLLGDFTVTHNTALALEILKNTSKAGIVSVFASLDMHRNRLFEKLLYKTTGLSRGELYAKVHAGEIEEITKKVKEDYANVWFYDRSCPTVGNIREYIEEVEAETGKKVKLVMLDYFERVNSDKSEDTAASKDIAGQLQDVVNDFNVAMVTLVQPNKFSLGSGPDKPIKSYTAIKGSSFLYQSFRSIVSIWRPFFTPETVDKDKFLQMAILKNDLGELGMFNFAWSGKRGEIREVTEEEEAELNYLLEQKKAAESNAKSESGWE